ncbi:MAG: SIMPL domain-containing protein [Clostridiales bacterium]|nr:SIMPL domain-containing protein [Clostridiales bacterium]
MTIKSKLLIALMLVITLSVGIFAGTLMKGEEKVLATTNENNDKNTVSASGEGVVRVTPDIAIVSLGVETNNKEMSKAQSENMEQMNEIMAELKKLGIQDEDIQTNNYSVYPEYDWNNNTQIFRGYKVTNTVSVKVRKIDDTGKVLDAVAAKGANRVNGIQFTVEETGKLYDEALKLAVKNAEEKAKVMTAYFGINKLTPITIKERSQGYYPLYDNGFSEYAMEAQSRSTPISTGQMEIRASVDVSFEY